MYASLNESDETVWQWFKSLMLDFLLLLEYLACNNYAIEVSCVGVLADSLGFEILAALLVLLLAAQHVAMGVKTASLTSLLVMIAVQATQTRSCVCILMTNKHAEKHMLCLCKQCIMSAEKRLIAIATRAHEP